MANNNIKMGKVRNNKLESVADVDIRIDSVRGFIVVPEVICDNNFSIPDYSKVVKMETVLIGQKSEYEESSITEETRNHVLSLIDEVGTVSGNVYAFKLGVNEEDYSEDYRVYVYIYDVSGSTVSSVFYIEGETEITVGSSSYNLYTVNDPEFSYFKFNADIEDICNKDNWEKLTTNLLFVDKDGYFRGFCIWSFQEIDHSDLISCELFLGEIFDIDIEMYFLSDGRYLIRKNR